MEARTSESTPKKDDNFAISRCCRNWLDTCSPKVPIDSIGRRGSTETIAWRIAAADTVAPGRVKDDVVQVMRAGIAVSPSLWHHVVLRFGQKKEWTNRLVEIEVDVACVLRYTYDFVETR